MQKSILVKRRNPRTPKQYYLQLTIVFGNKSFPCDISPPLPGDLYSDVFSVNLIRYVYSVNCQSLSRMQFVRRLYRDEILLNWFLLKSPRVLSTIELQGARVLPMCAARTDESVEENSFARVRWVIYNKTRIKSSTCLIYSYVHIRINNLTFVRVSSAAHGKTANAPRQHCGLALNARFNLKAITLPNFWDF